MSIIEKLGQRNILQYQKGFFGGNKLDKPGLDLNNDGVIQDNELIPDTNKNGKIEAQEALEYLIARNKKTSVCEEVERVIKADTGAELSTDERLDYAYALRSSARELNGIKSHIEFVAVNYTIRNDGSISFDQRFFKNKERDCEATNDNKNLFDTDSYTSTVSFRTNKYLGQYALSIPPQYAGTLHRIRVTLPDQYRQIAYLQGFTQKEGMFSREGVTPPTGFTQALRFTQRAARWRVVVTNTVRDPAHTAHVWIPRSFGVGAQTIEDHAVSFSHTPVKQEQTADEHAYTFENTSDIKEYVISTRATIRTGEGHTLPEEDPAKHLSISDKEAEACRPIIEQLRNDPAYEDAPLVVRLGLWVNKNLKYDLSWAGRTLPLSDVVKEKTGVCEHFAQLYLALCRTAGIPAYIITGHVFNNGSWRGHAWVIVHDGSRWLSMDPTWGLFSGELPVSHLGFDKNSAKHSIRAQFVEPGGMSFDQLSKLLKKAQEEKKTAPADQKRVDTTYEFKPLPIDQ